MAISLIGYYLDWSDFLDNLFIQLKLDGEGKSKLSSILTDRNDRSIFMELVELMHPFWNSIDYKSMKNLGEQIGIKSRTYISSTINRFERLNLVKRYNNYLYINYNYVTKCEDKLLRQEVLDLFESDEHNQQDKPKGTLIVSTLIFS